jgi:hypothetical protein
MAAIEYRGLWIEESIVRLLDANSKDLPLLRESLDAKNREFDALPLPYPEPFATELEDEIDVLQREVGTRTEMTARILKRQLMTGPRAQTFTYTANKVAELTGLTFEKACALLGVVS